MYASLKETIAATAGTNYGKLHYYHRVTKSYRKARYYRVQQIYDRNGFVIKQIIHYM